MELCGAKDGDPEWGEIVNLRKRKSVSGSFSKL